MGSIIGPYVTVAHEMGHNFGFSHDTGMFSPKWEKWGGGGGGGRGAVGNNIRTMPFTALLS